MYRAGASTRASSSAASSPRTNPLRSNNDREDNGERRRASYEPANSSRRPLGDSSSELSTSQSWDGDQEVKGQQLNKMIGVWLPKARFPCVVTNSISCFIAILRQRCPHRRLLKSHTSRRPQSGWQSSRKCLGVFHVDVVPGSSD
jgi:hypothetical protein